MEPSAPTDPIDVAAVRAVVELTPTGVQTRLEPVQLTIWIGQAAGESVFCLDAGTHTILRLTEESTHRFERALHTLLRRWLPPNRSSPP